MMLKQYITHLLKNVPADSEKPGDIVQLLACLIGTRLSNSGKLPQACGVGEGLDMDIINAGIEAGLAKVKDYDPAQGTMRQFLYPSIAGTMQMYAWERENRVADSRPREWPLASSPEEADGERLNDALIDYRTPETEMIEEEEAITRGKGIRAAVAGLGTEDMAMLLRDAQIGYNAAKRQAWAAEIGVSVGALSMRLSRLRRAAREWALTVQ